MKKLILSMIFLLFLSGCGPELIVGPAINFFLVWKNGEAHKCYRHSSETVYFAAKRSLREMDIPIIEDEQDEDPGFYFIAGKNDQFKVTIDEIEPLISRLSVRINFLGDTEYTELFYLKVDEELSTIEYDENGRPKDKRKLFNKSS
ncbi:MAG: DUF3568 family protein [Candidatus Thorarchaeota archaeon]|jgi:hypothetical protein